MQSAAAPASKPTVQSVRSTARTADPIARFTNVNDDEQWLKLDLADLALPKVNDLRVDGLKPSWFARLFFGKR